MSSTENDMLSLFPTDDDEVTFSDQVPEPGQSEMEFSSESRPRRRANGLSGKDWTRYSISIWSDLRKAPEEVVLKHPASFPVTLVTRLIECFTNAEDQVILDPFAGIGSTLVAAQRQGKTAIGIELSPEFATKAQQRCGQQMLFAEAKGSATVHVADARHLLEYVEVGSVDLVVTSPPYWDVLSQKRTADYKAIRDYGTEVDDLGKVSDYHEFLRQLQDVFRQVYIALRPGAYCCVIVMDIRKKDKFYPFHSDLAKYLCEVGFLYDDLIIWDRRHEYNNMRPLGYPSVFRINKAHEFIVIFQKPKSSIE